MINLYPSLAFVLVIANLAAMYMKDKVLINWWFVVLFVVLEIFLEVFKLSLMQTILNPRPKPVFPK